MNKYSTELLEKHFDTAFSAPNGIKKLRELILTLAMQGRLVPQDPSERPADELLKEIAAEKQRLVKEGKIKRPKPLPPVTEEEEPYSLPQGWQWVRFGEIAQHNSGKTLDGGRNTGLPRKYITTSNVYWGKFQLNNVREMLIREEELDKCSARKGDLLICEGGEAGRAAVWELLEEICFQNHVHRARLYKGVNPYFAYRFFEKINASGEVNNYRKGVGISNMSSKALASIVFPLPPNSEQHRIIAKIDELMARCDELEKLRTAQREARLAVHTTAIKRLLNIAEPDQHQLAQTFLAEHFGELYAVKENIVGLREAILQLAVMGKLVPQDPHDHPASELLKKVSASREGILKSGYPSESESKGQLRKQENQHLPKNLPDLPQGWVWSTLMQCALIVVDCHNKTAPYSDSGIVLLRTSNIRSGRILLDDVKYVSEEIFGRWSARVEPQPGDILITREAPMGEVCIIPEEPKVCMGQRMMLVRLVPETISPQFLLYSLRDPKLMERVQDKPVGMTVQHLRVGGIETLLVPLPPLLEQNRIVEKIDELMALCDSLERKMDASLSKQTELLSALIRVQSQGGTVEGVHRSSRSIFQVIDLATYRASIGCYAINKLATTQYFGRTTAAKVMYLAQAHVGLSLDLKPERQAAGPLDTWIYHFEQQGQGMRWFEVYENSLVNGRKKTEYRCLSGLSEPVAKAEALMTLEQKAEFDRLIYALAGKTTEEVEIIATLFAVWNDFLIDGAQPTDTEIISGVRGNWHERKARFTPVELGRWLDWLRRKNIIPRGLPPRTVQQSLLPLH